MFLLVVGGDLRYAHLTALAARRMEAAALGLENAPVSAPAATPEDLSRADAVLLPNPWRSGMLLPYAARPFSLEEVLERLPPGARLLLSDAAGMTGIPADVEAIDLSQNPSFVLRNAHLTAEAAVFSAMNRLPFALSDSRALVIGYGRIARRLGRLLSGMGTQCAVVARREAARAQAEADGLDAFPMESLDRLLPRAQIIFTTPPARVLGEELLRRIPPESLLIDLASPPFGFDLATARALGVNAHRESGLPGRYCPLSAAQAMLQAVETALKA